MQTAFAFEARVTVGTPLDLGDGPLGRRRVVPITGGTFEGPRLKGTVMPGGADWQLIRTDGVAELEARYVLRADDGTLVSVVNRALRRGPADVMQRLAAGETVDPALYYFRGTPTFQAPAGQHDWLTRSIFVADGVRWPDVVIVRVFEVL
jgi:hypothetical protein